MSCLHCIGIYPDAIDKIACRCHSLLHDMDIDDRKLDENVEEYLSQEPFEDITNRIIKAYFEVTKSLVLDKTKANVSYFVNCHDSHIWINGEEYYENDLLY